jgi:hypothetical protein
MITSSAEITTIQQKKFEDQVIPQGATHYSIVYGNIAYWSYRFHFRGIESGTEYHCWHYWNGAAWAPDSGHPERKAIANLAQEDVFKEIPITDSERESLALLESIHQQDKERIAALSN